MEELAEAGKIKVGVKYDQPGLGFKDADRRRPDRLRHRDRQDPRRRPRHRPASDKVDVGGDDLRQPRAVPRGGQGRPGARVVLHHRRASRRSSARPAPTIVTGQQLLVQADSDVTGDRRPQGQGGLLGDRLDLARERRRAEGAKPRRLRHLLRVRRRQVLDGTGRRRCRPTARSCSATPRRTRASSKVVGEPFSEERIGVGYSKDTPGDVRVDQRRARGGLRGRRLGRGLRAHARHVGRGDPGAAGRSTPAA